MTSQEIERKFIVDKLPENIEVYPNNKYIQYYISLIPETRIRSIDDTSFKLTIKSGEGLSRTEFEIDIDQEFFNRLSTLSLGSISKTRYQIDGLEVDIYDDIDLITAEKEFNSEDEANSFIKPVWLGKEVTYDKAYKNKNLAIFKNKI